MMVKKSIKDYIERFKSDITFVVRYQEKKKI